MKALALYAGPAARAHIERHGIAPQHISAVAGAAGGPKGLILGPLDQFIFGQWMRDSEHPVDLIGASIGAWRMAAACRADPARAFAALQHDYIHQTYTLKPGQKRPSAQQVSDQFALSLQRFFGDELSAILQHPRYRLHVHTSQGRLLLNHERKGLAHAGFALAFASNALHRRGLGFWLKRVVFSTPGAALPFAPDGYPTQQLDLTLDNFMQAVRASCSIPFVMQSVPTPIGAPRASYWDGGLVDYHLHLRYTAKTGFDADQGLVLYPHFQRQVIPGWLDKGLKSRHGATSALDHVLLLAPTPEWVASLPDQKLPDRTDFVTYLNDAPARIAAWQTACDAARQLADEWQAWVERPNPELIQPL